MYEMNVWYKVEKFKNYKKACDQGRPRIDLFDVIILWYKPLQKTEQFPLRSRNYREEGGSYQWNEKNNNMAGRIFL